MTSVWTGVPDVVKPPPAAVLAVCDNGRERPEPVQIGVCGLDAGRAGEPVTWLVRPTAPIAPVMTLRVHGLGDADVAGAPGLPEVWPQVSDVVGGRLLVVHNAGRILGTLAGLPDPGTAGLAGVLDTLRLARHRRVSVGGSYALAPLIAATRVNATPVPRFERADWTALATAALFTHLVTLPPLVPFHILTTWCRADLPPGWPDPSTPEPWPTVLREAPPLALPNPAIGRDR
ncbi:MAG TPA: 3'-5' exonuclease [Mycobacteriales bacterium]|nr:3'-5' exonuclease [Mycobacteriales bacterium]